MDTLKLAHELGATTAVIAAADVATSVIAYARSHNLSKLVIGRDPARRLRPWQRSSGQKLASLAPDIDLVEIGRADGAMQNGEAKRSSWPTSPGADSSDQRKFKHVRYLWAALVHRSDVAVDAVGRSSRSVEHRGDFYLRAWCWSRSASAGAHLHWRRFACLFVRFLFRSSISISFRRDSLLR